MEVVEVAEHQRRFEAAVRAVKSLPNDGSYKPSHELMLKFYGFYKQATQGPCKIGRPGFWDPVGRYKWDAWNSLGEMSKVEAMIAYVDEMKKVGGQILESMPVTDKVEELLHLLGPFYEVVCDMPRPPGFPTSQAAEKLDRMAKSLEELSGVLTSTPNHNGQAHFQDSQDEDDSIDDDDGKNPLLQVKWPESDQHEERESHALHAESGDAINLNNQMINLEQYENSERNNGLDSGRESDLGSSPPESMTGSESELEHITQMEHGEEGPEQSGEDEERRTPQESDFDQKYTSSGRTSVLAGGEARVQHLTSDSDSEVFCDSVEQIMLEEAWESAGGTRGLLKHSDALDQHNCLSADLAITRPVGHGGEGLGPGQGKPGNDKTGPNEGERRGIKPERGGRRATPREGARGHHSGGTGAAGGDGEDVGESRRHRTDVSEQIAATLVRLQQDMQSVLQRLSTLEALAATQARSVAFSPQHYEMHVPARSNHSGWPFEMSAPALIFFMVWPFVAQWLVHVLRRRRKIKKAGAFLSLH
ncbi:acyl-CoA-binding domain-containing protein 5-like isoform X1 [Lampetra planeri]